MRHLVNLFTTLTNLSGWTAMRYTYANRRYLDCALILTVMLASMFHHLSAINRGLPAICMEAWAVPLLIIDQIMATITIVRGLYLCWWYQIRPNATECGMFFLALLCLGYSNGYLSMVTTFWEQVTYAITHGFWHMLAFWIYYQIQIYVVRCQKRCSFLSV